MKRWLIAALAVGALVAVTGGTAATSKPYIGKWKAQVTAEQNLDYGVVDPRASGRYTLILTKTGTYRLYNPLDRWSNGTFTVSGRRIIFAEVSGWMGGCKATTKRGLYRWSIEAGELKFQTVVLGGDPCGGRWGSLTIPTWTRA